MSDAPIGIYDSGFGGLTVWREIRRALPEESLIYLGDGKNCPYGSLSEERVAELADAAVRQLLVEGCKLIVVACNTATAAAIERLRETFPSTPFVGLEPAVKPACLHTRSGVVGVVATERSLAGGKFLTTVERYCGGKRVVKAVGRGWVEAVEADEEHTPETERRVREILDPIMAAGADVIVLGCTHYPFLRDVIERVIGDRDIEVIDSGAAVEKRVESLLDQYDLRAARGHEASYRFMSMAGDDYCERLRRKAFASDGCAQEK